MSQKTPPREAKCNCFPDLLHVPTKGEFLVRNGEVYSIIEVDGRDHTDEYYEYAVYTRVDDQGDEVLLSTYDTE